MDGASRPELAAIAALLANEARASMMLAMLDGRAWTATELAHESKVSASSATEHLHRLVHGGLVSELRRGRHRYLRITDPSVADMVEALAAYSGRVYPAEPSVRGHRADKALRNARTCYRHLAGRLGVDLSDGLRRVGYIDGNWTLTSGGHDWFTTLGVVLPQKTRQPLLRPCLDWTERREHLAGPAADALLAAFRTKEWIAPGHGRRDVVLTPEGRAALREILFGQQVPDG